MRVSLPEQPRTNMLHIEEAVVFRSRRALSCRRAANGTRAAAMFVVTTVGCGKIIRGEKRYICA